MDQPNHKVPVLELFKDQLAISLAAASGLSVADAKSLIDSGKADGFEFSITLQKIKKFKIMDDPATVGEQWKAKV
mgnify:CR=1 FL=1